MFFRSQRVAEGYYAFWAWLVNLKKRTTLLPVNFQAPWTTIIWSQKRFLLIALLCQCIVYSFYALYPQLIGTIIETQQLSLFSLLLGVWLGMIGLEFVAVYFSARLEIQTINSIQFNAFKFFITVDPIHHTLKESGKLFAKIERGARSYEDLLDIILWDIVPTVVSTTAVAIAFLSMDLQLGLVAIVLLIIIALLNTALTLFTGATFEQKLIEADDDVKIVNAEHLTQAQLVRSAFATTEVISFAKKANKRLMYKTGTALLAFFASRAIPKIAYLISIGIIGSIIFSAVNEGTLSIVSATALLFTYINGTYEIILIGRHLKKLTRAVTRVTDLFSFIQGFGKQTFPVLDQEPEKCPTIGHKEKISLVIEDLYFDYNARAKIFEDHRLHLEVPSSQKNKLYGIIGPSGVGKTTLLSILGGQLKPNRGKVLINNVPIYSIDDTERRTLLAMQGQIASSLSGTIKNNVLLGLPTDSTIYKDKEIIEVLKQVGIWNIFEEKEGLYTPVGEGGLTLSGGQRQRLNFASLFLRARYYKPLIVLIDEPTSSLDELSESTITKMMLQLAENALTLVIAHRLKTIEDAVGILDFSLLDSEKDMLFYSRQELEKKSVYFNKLMQGDVDIDI